MVAWEQIWELIAVENEASLWNDENIVKLGFVKLTKNHGIIC